MDDFLQKLKKVVRIVLYGPVISQLGCRKAGSYQLPLNKCMYQTNCRISEVCLKSLHTGVKKSIGLDELCTAGYSCFKLFAGLTVTALAKLIRKQFLYFVQD